MKRFILIATVILSACLGVRAQEYVPVPVTVSKEKVKLNGKIYLSHVVLEKQTLYGISRAYGVTEEELYEANPSLRQTGLQKNAILLIPYKESRQAAVDDEARQDYTEHTVRWFEDIDDIARHYGVTVRDIMEANGLKNKKLSTRQVLKIPLRKAAAAEQPSAGETPAVPAEEVLPPVEEGEEESVPAADSSGTVVFKARDAVEFSLVLPLKNGTGAAESNMDFYCGVLLALKDLEAEGLRIKAHVHDLGAGLPSAEALAQSDFVLGPIAARDVEAVLQRVEGKVPVISPLDQKAAPLSQYYRNFIQGPSAAENQYEELVQWLREERREEDRIILVTQKGAASVSASVAIRSAMAQRELPYEILNYAITEGRGIPNTLTQLMTKNGVNRVVVASESEAFVGDAVRNIGIMLGKGYDVVMYAPSRVRTFDTVEGSAYHDASLHLCTAYHADYAGSEVDRFVRAYRALYRTEPSQFAFQGYDTARFFVRQAAAYGPYWPLKLAGEKGRGLHTDFIFVQDGNGNAVNRAVRRIVFKKDYTTSLSK